MKEGMIMSLWAGPRISPAGQAVRRPRFARTMAWFLCLLCSCQSWTARGQAGRSLISYVDPFVGADGGGNTVPGAGVPFGFTTSESGANRAGKDSERK